MKLRRAALLATLSALATLGTVAAAPASAAPLWNLDIHHDETNFPPGGTAEISFDLRNLGDSSSSGPVNLNIDLPAGITRHSFRLDNGTFDGTDTVWDCPGAAGDSSFACTSTTSINGSGAQLSNARNLILTVDVAPDAAPDLIASATVSGGGAPDAPPAAGCPPGVSACATEAIHVSPALAPFGVVDGSWIADFYQADSVTPIRKAGSHPDLATFNFDFNSIQFGLTQAGDPQKSPSGSVRNVQVDLPPGFYGDPTAVGECTPLQLQGGSCPPSSQVGVLEATVQSGNGSTSRYNFNRPLFNMVHPLGAITDLAGVLAGKPVHIKVSLDPANGYSIRTVTANINETVRPMHTRVTVWGVPSESVHDGARRGADCVGCSTPASKAFLTLPPRCDGDNPMTFSHYNSWQESAVFGPDLTYFLPGNFRECDLLTFEPSVRLDPTGRQANTPTGVDVSIQVPQSENPNALATPPVKSTVVTFPEGMTFNPAFADGLDGCSLDQIGLGTNDPVACPNNSRIGEVFLTTPLLPKPLEGSMYLAKQGENPFGTTFAIYMAVHDTEDRGVLVKIPGRIDLDPSTGQITTTFDDLPQFPFDDFTLSFRSGQRAPLVNPPTCGTHRIAVQIASYAQPGRALDASSAYEVNEGPGGAPCSGSSASRPFDPKINAGTLNPVAGGYSPFLFRLTRQDTEQDISRVTAKLPLGLTAKLAGVDICPDASIAQISTAEGTGKAESINPHCPLGSMVGALNAGVGAGTSPNFFLGRVFLAGPYNGAPLSFVTVVPAIAGPFDLGNVVVRIAAQIDPRTSEVTATSDAFPPIVQGVLVRVRDIRLNMNRDQFTLNPTRCNPMSVDASIFSDLGALATPSSRFQAGECAALGFKPKLNLRLRGGTRRGAHPQLTANLVPRSGDANIASLSVAFPRSEFLENAHIRTVCTRPDFAADNCPAGAIYGHATAYTPILDYPLQANVFLRSSDNLLPDVVPDFRGPPTQPIKFESAGRVDSVNGGIRNTFGFIPDAPISRVLFRLQGGKKGLLVNSRDICKRTYRAKVVYTAHNGRRYVQRPKVVAIACKKARKHKGKRGAHKRSKRAMLAHGARVR